MILYEKCPMAQTLSLLNGKWKPSIFKELIANPVRYNELSRRINTVSPKVLSQQLQQMESDGIILRTVYKETAPQLVEYSLTELGINLIPLLATIRIWGLKNLKNKDGSPSNCGDCNNCLPIGC